MQWPFVKRSKYEQAKDYADVAQARAMRAEERLERVRERFYQERRVLLRQHDALLEHLAKVVSLTPPAPLVLSQADGAMIPDPPSVRDNDTKVAVAMRDREAPPLKRALRPGEDE